MKSKKPVKKGKQGKRNTNHQKGVGVGGRKKTKGLGLLWDNPKFTNRNGERKRESERRHGPPWSVHSQRKNGGKK